MEERDRIVRLWFEMWLAQKDLGIDEEYEGIGHCILGYPAGDLPKTPERKENRVYHID